MGIVFSGLILDVGDLDRSLAFYHGLLGLPISRCDKRDRLQQAHLSTGSTEVVLIERPETEQDPALERTGGQVIKFVVGDLPLLATALADQRIDVVQPLGMSLPGERTLLVSDPDGYIVLLSQPVESVHLAGLAN